LLTRNEPELRSKLTRETPKNFSIFEIDISKTITSLGFASHIVHTSTPTSQTHLAITNVEEASLIGARNLLDSISWGPQKPIFLNLSSGAVYGLNFVSKGPIPLSTPVSFPEVIKDFTSQYASAKIRTEEFINQKTEQGEIIGCNPRLFSFFGPLLPIDGKYAIGNFMKSVISSECIKLNTQGDSVRSYLHASSLASQLVYLLSNPIRGESHIGSTYSKPLKWWAEYLTGIFDTGPIKYGNSPESPSFYAPVADPRIPDFDLTESEREHEFLYWYNWLKNWRAR
jgi:nucleoside-diphosphate-sugar epimerase